MKNKPLVARKVTYEQSDADLYETPSEITKMILDRLVLHKKVKFYEPAFGLGAISNVVKSYGFKCKESDINDGVDFLQTKGKQKYNVVITNPPYKYAQEFIIKSFEHIKDDGLVVMLLRLSFLESAKRYDFFKNSGIFEIHVSCKRITMHPANRPKPKNSGTVAYAWFVFKKGYKGEPVLKWFND